MVITPVGEGKEDQCIWRRPEKECQVTVNPATYQYVTAKDVLTSLASGNSEYELIGRAPEHR